jgi:ubiquinone/menaquinone biosynthesis C-methylase UbiE
MPPVSLDLDTKQLAEEYERISVERQFRAGKRLIAELAVKTGESILDVGAGTGLLAEYVAAIVGPAGRVVGIDPLPLRIEIANRRSHSGLSFKVADANDLSEFKENEFDAAYMNAVFHWLPDKRVPLHQVFRVLKSGGRLGIVTGVKGNSNPLHGIRERVMKRPPYNLYQQASGPVAYRVTPEELRHFLTEAGFAIAKLELRTREQPEASPEELIQFSEASSFGNFLGHLPVELREAARADIKVELAKAPTLPAVRQGIIAVAIRP